VFAVTEKNMHDEKKNVSIVKKIKNNKKRLPTNDGSRQKEYGNQSTSLLVALLETREIFLSHVANGCIKPTLPTNCDLQRQLLKKSSKIL
jgi:hypothetical protein